MPRPRLGLAPRGNSGKLDVKMTSAYHAVADLARKRNLYMRDAAYVIAVSRVVEACKGRGWI